MCSHSDDNSYLSWIILKLKGRPTKGRQVHRPTEARIYILCKRCKICQNLQTGQIASRLRTQVPFPSCPLQWWTQVKTKPVEKRWKWDWIFISSSAPAMHSSPLIPPEQREASLPPSYNYLIIDHLTRCHLHKGTLPGKCVGKLNQNNKSCLEIWNIFKLI